jgi:ribosomal protein L37E
MPLPYPDPRVALATLHGKERVLAPALAEVGLRIEPVSVDTDALGTFSGEVERLASARDTVIAKARMGMQASGCALGLATEASFGPDPIVGFVPVHHELIAFVDDVHGQVLVLEHLSRETNWQSKAVRAASEADTLLLSSGFPEHALLVRPNQAFAGMPVHKGLRDRAALEHAIAECASSSADGLARVETDMRAHMNPTRMRQLRALATQLAERLSTPCPSCSTPGFGRTHAHFGLPCSECGEPTEMVRAEVWSCAACHFEQEHPRSDGRVEADPGACPHCNP